MGNEGSMTGINTLQTLQSRNEDTQAIYSLAFSSDGKTLVSGSDDGLVVLWDVRVHDDKQLPFDDPLARFFVGGDGGVTVATLSSLGLLAAATCQPPLEEPYCLDDGVAEVYLWDIATGDKVGQFASGHAGSIGDLAFSPNGQILAVAGGNDHTIRLFDVTTGRQIGRPISSSSMVLDFSPNGRYLAFSGKTEGHVILLDIENQTPVGEFSGLEGSITDVVFSPDGKLLAAAESNGAIRIWEIKTRTPQGSSLRGQSIAFSPDGKLIASGNDKDFILWDADTYHQLGQYTVGKEGYSVASLAFSPDSRTLVMGVIGAPMPRQWENKVILWDVTQQQQLAEFWDGWQYFNYVGRITFSKDGHAFVINSDHTAVLWNINPVSWQARPAKPQAKS